MASSRDTFESCPSLDIRLLSRRRKLWPSGSFIEPWVRAGDPVGSIRVSNGPNHILLGFCCLETSPVAWKHVDQNIRVVWTSCALGGGRPWFVCPVVGCGRRVALIYLSGLGVFACRKCHDLAYATQFEAVGRRGMERARRIRLKLGGGPNLCDPFPDRPRRMHRRTYARLSAAYELAALRCGAL